MVCSLQGVLYGSPATPEAPATVLWRPFDNAQTQQWSLALPDGEEAAAVAAGRQFSAAAMSTRMLRIFAESGTFCICLDLPLWLCLHGHDTCPLAEGSCVADMLLGFLAVVVPPKDLASWTLLQLARLVACTQDQSLRTDHLSNCASVLRRAADRGADVGGPAGGAGWA